jgi:hypothetical protein
MPDVVGMYAQAGVRLRAARDGDWVSTRCFAGTHDDRHPSARVHLKSGGFVCFTCGARGGAIAALELLGVDQRRAIGLAVDYGVLNTPSQPLTPRRQRWQRMSFFARAPATDAASASCAPSDVDAASTIDWVALANEAVTPVRERTWVYVDADGVSVGRVRRFDLGDGRKSIFQERPEGDGWQPGLNGAHLPLYRLPDVRRRARAGERVFVVEGEKSVDAVDRLGLFATTNAGGAGKWRDDHTTALNGAHVTAIADCDLQGRRHAVDVSARLLGAGVRVTAPLDPEPQRTDGYDIVDDLTALAATVRAVTPGIPDGELRARLRRNLLDRVATLRPADAVALDRYIERVRFDAGDLHNGGALAYCDRCRAVRPHLVRVGLAYCPCGNRPTLAAQHAA